MKLLLALLGAYLLVINIDAYALMASDKARARRGKRRIPEATLFIVSALGGSLSTLCAMHTLRHKTKHTTFTVGVPLLLFFQAVIITLVVYLAVK